MLLFVAILHYFVLYIWAPRDGNLGYQTVLISSVALPMPFKSQTERQVLLDRLVPRGWMMDDLWVIIHPGWMIWEAMWMMALDNEKNEDFRLREVFHFCHSSVIPVSTSFFLKSGSMAAQIGILASSQP